MRRTFGAWVLTMLACSAAVRGADKEVVVLRTNSSYWSNYKVIATPWRVHETWSTDVARTDAGTLVRVSGFDPREGEKVEDSQLVAGRYALNPAKRILGSPPAPAGWTAVEFDDSTWFRRRGPVEYAYRSLAVICARGKFVVTDPAKAEGLKLSLDFHGGAVVTVNGTEVARKHLSAGTTGTVHGGTVPVDTLAEDYPVDVTMDADGHMIHVDYRAMGKEKYEAMLARRRRSLECVVPSRLLKAGVNVVAVEIHRAPGPEAMFTTVQGPGGVSGLESNRRRTYWWNRCSLESIRLTAPEGATGVVPNVARPDGLQVWNHPTWRWVDAYVYANPGETVQPMRLTGARNGICSGQVVAAAKGGLVNLTVKTSDLAGPGGRVIPASALTVRYPRHREGYRNIGYFDALEATPEPFEDVQPVWLTMNVPRDAAPGNYTGKLTVAADTRTSVEVPVALDVVDWTLPDPRDFTTFVGIIQSPESVAMQYEVEMWSDAHLKRLEESFRLMSLVGARTLYIPVKCRSHFGNPHTMVRWVKSADGSHKLDFRLVDKYLDVALKHLDKLRVVCLVIYDGGPSHTKPEAAGTFVTEVDPGTGALTEMKAPDWGSPESPAFWKPVFDGVRERLAKRGIEKTLMVGLAQGVTGECVYDLREAAPDAQWVAHSHLYHEHFARYYGKPGQPVGYLAQVGGLIAVFWDPEDGRHFYGWQNDRLQVVYPRDGHVSYNGPYLRVNSPLTVLRLGAEGSMLTGRQQRWQRKWKARMDSMAVTGHSDWPGVAGFGRLGADFWPVLKSKTASYPIAGRYPGSDWGTLDIKDVSPYLLMPGPDGAISSVRFELLRQGLQEAETRIFVQNALLDEAKRAKLGKALAGRVTEITNERTRTFRYVSEYWDDGVGRYLLTGYWDEMSAKLLRSAAEVAAALR
ncbi:MAG TPA: glycoside hydrolase domain-containing protein [Planctomycetota bacterium]|nr:glycoside hydrolase domain-containing protein [Planctomycetota bacterium]